MTRSDAIVIIIVMALLGATVYAVTGAVLNHRLLESKTGEARERVRLDGMRTGIRIEHCRTFCSSWEFQHIVLAEPTFDNLVGYVLPWGPDGTDQCVCILQGEDAPQPYGDEEP